MRPKALWIGIGLVAAGYLAWTATHLAAPASPGLPAASSATPSAMPTGTLAASPSPTPITPLLTPTPTPAVAPTLLLNAGRVTRRSVVVASAMGFRAGEPLRLSLREPNGSTVALGTHKADSHGEASGLLIRVSDTWPNGIQQVKITGLTSRRTATASFELAGSPPGAAPTSYAGKPMSKVDFNGGGFSPGESVDVYFDTLASPVLGSFTANQIGVVHVAGVSVPMAAPGQHAFLLVGRRSRAPVRVPFSVLAFSPWLGLSSYTPQPEQTIDVTGHDFAPGERVAIFLDSDRGWPVSQATVDRSGTFHAHSAVEIPYDRRGKTEIVAVGTESQTEAAATLTVRPYTPLFALSRYAGPPGTTFDLQGKGFAKNEDVRIRLGDSQQSLVFDFHTDGLGELIANRSIEIPRSMAAGKVTVSALGNHSQVPASVTFAVTPLSPWFVPAPAAGPAGRRVTFTGGGFAPDETVRIAIKTDAGTMLGTTLTTDSAGAIRRGGTLLIPNALKGRVSIEATGAQSGARATAVYTVTGGTSTP